MRSDTDISVDLRTDRPTTANPGLYLVICPTHRDERELTRLGRDAMPFLRHDYASLALEELVGASSSAAPEITDPLDEVEHILACFGDQDLAGVVSTDDYPGSTLACIIAERFGLRGCSPAVNLICQHKYYARLAQQIHVPEAVPEFALLDIDSAASLRCGVPIRHRFGSEQAHGRAGDEVTLDVEVVVDGGMDGQEALR